ncbi:hypothetical protein [Amycolatopsis japonica]
MKYRRNSGEAARFLKTNPQLRIALTRAAAAKLARMRSTVSKDSGATAASGRLVHQSRAGGKRDRMGVRIAFGGRAVPLQFGNKRTKATRFMTRAMVDR